VEYTKYEASRVIAAWLNSTYGMIPYIGYRAETRGAYGEWKTRQVRRISALDPSKLSSEQVDALLDAYEDVRDREWTHLRKQLNAVQNEEHHPRRELDRKVGRALFLDEDDLGSEDSGDESNCVDAIIDLDNLYEDFDNTLTLLGELME
jgi:hypothetical protein